MIEPQRIVELATCNEHIDTLARWHHDEWATLYGHSWSLDDAVDELRDQAERRVWSNTLVALRGEALCGSVSVVTDDAAELAHFGSPWLASLFVAAKWRGRGIGVELLGAACEWAARHDVARLLLFTAGQRDFYLRRGWQAIAATTLHGAAVDICEFHLSAPQPR